MSIKHCIKHIGIVSRNFSVLRAMCAKARYINKQKKHNNKTKIKRKQVLQYIC